MNLLHSRVRTTGIKLLFGKIFACVGWEFDGRGQSVVATDPKKVPFHWIFSSLDLSSGVLHWDCYYCHSDEKDGNSSLQKNRDE